MVEIITNNNGLKDRIRKKLEEWGAKVFFMDTNIDGDLIVDFKTPYKVRHPVNSSFILDKNTEKIKEATIRYGFVDKKNRINVNELSNIIEKANPPKKGNIRVNYGEEGKKPHILINARELGIHLENSFIQRKKGKPNIFKTIKFIKKAGDILEKEVNIKRKTNNNG